MENNLIVATDMKNKYIYIIMLCVCAVLHIACSDDGIDFNTNDQELKEADSWNVDYDITGTLDGHGYVDLGLSVKWATCNIGSSHPLSPGLYFAWGEVTAKDSYSWDNYKFALMPDFLMTKYCLQKNVGLDGLVDELSVLQPEDDAATQNWGENWRMPTDGELEELRTLCTWQWVVGDNINFYKVTAPNGHYILIPACGSIKNKERIMYVLNGCLWTSSLSATSSVKAHELTFYNSGYWEGSVERYYGEQVRAVLK